MITKVLLIFLFMLNSVFAQQVNVQVDSREIVVNEPFSFRVSVSFSGDEDPSISFNPSNLEILGRENLGVSTRTIYSGGRITVSREMTYAYEAIAKNLGTATLRDIRVSVGGNTLSHANVTFNVRREPIRLADIFIEAIPSKTDVLVGEQISLNYFIYSKVNFSGFEIKTFPKLNGFFKRPITDDQLRERVEYKGEVYVRSLIYSSVIFAEKPGRLTADPMEAKVSYLDAGNANAFSFGFGMRAVKSKTLSSRPIPINVLPLPSESLPPNFTGMVGKHKFNISINKTKFLANEPIEITLTVEGPGMLENMDAPKILSHPELEEFESTAEVQLKNANSGIKTFKYVFLGRSALNLPETKVTLSFFDSSQNKYEIVSLQIPAIEVVGGAYNSSQDSKEENSLSEPSNDSPLGNILNPNKPEKKITTLIGLVFDKMSVGPWGNKILAFVLFIFIGLVGWSYYLSRPQVSEKTPEIQAINNMKRGEINYHNLFLAISIGEGNTAHEKIQSLEINNDAKKYFLNLLEYVNKGYNSNDDKKHKIHIDKKMLNQLKKVVVNNVSKLDGDRAPFSWKDR